MNLKRSVVLAGLTLLSCSSPMKIMTYNVGVFGKYLEDSKPLVNRIIRHMEADIVSLNELDSCNRRHDVYQIEELAGLLGGWDYHFTSAFPYAGGAYGNGIVSRSPILQRWSIALPKGEGSEPRSAAVVETDRCILASVHLDHKNKEAQLEQARILNEWFTERFSGFRKPVFLCGDMNAVPDDLTIAELEKVWTLLSFNGASYPSRSPRKCIDYIFRLTSSRKVKVLAGGTPSLISIGAGHTGISAIPIFDASDHLPVWVKVRF